MTANALTTALANVGEVVTSAVGVITDNSILMTLFAGTLLAVGFRAIKWAKRAVR